MRTIYKYELSCGGINNIKMPQSANILHLGLDPVGKPCFWAEVQTDAPIVSMDVVGIGTGWPLDELFTIENNFFYLGTINDGIYMWHYYGRIDIDGGKE